MTLSRFVPKAALSGALTLALPVAAWAQGNYTPSGSEYAIAGTLPGDQMRPQVSLTRTNGYLVWQDNVTDGYGLGISALRLDSSFSGAYAPFRVNVNAAGDQERPQVAMLGNGGAAFVWQGGPQGYQHIYARLLSSSNTWITGDVMVNSATAQFQMNPALALLPNGNIVVVYASMNQFSSTSQQDVYGQILSPAGQKVGSEFLVNQFTAFNQRTPAVAPLAGGGFVVVWVSEQERSLSLETDQPTAYALTNQATVDIYGRVYTAAGTPTASEFLVNTSNDVCANPRVAAGSDGNFMVAWGQKSPINPTNSWDIFARPFSSIAVGGPVVGVNTQLYGDQYIPQITALGTDYLVVWTSLGQDGSREGVYGQFLRGSGTPFGGEFRVNTTTIGQQMQPTVAADGTGRFLAVWTSFVGGAGSFDLFAQRYLNTAQALTAMNPPFVYVPFLFSNSVYQAQIQVSWPAQAGLPIDHYEVYVNGSLAPAASLTTNVWLMTGLSNSTTYNFQVAYVLTDTRRSPLSPPASATTWGGYGFYGIPIEWMSTYWSNGEWPAANTPLVPGGPTPLQAFLTGADPLDPTTWLRVQLASTPQGFFVNWNPQPGLVYQVQFSTDLNTWVNLGTPRFAAGTTDSLFAGVTNVGYYRVLRLR